MRSQQQVRDFIVDKLNEKNIALNAASIAIGRTGSYLFQFIRRGVPKRLPEADRKKLAALLEVDEQELTDINLSASSYEPPFITAAGMVYDKAADMLSKFRQPTNVSIDIMDASACCGNGIENIIESKAGSWILPFDEFRSITNTSPEKIKMLRASGDSMAPTIKDGDWVLTDVSNNFISSDGLYLIRLSTGLAIKRLQAGLSNITVKSDNPLYADITADAGEIVVIGRIIYILNAIKV